MRTKNEKFGDYLQSKSAGKGKVHTHTRIGDKLSKICGGTYNILEEDYEGFMEKYYQHVFVCGNKEYLTEKQLIENGPIMLDIDLHYEPEIKERMHTDEHIVDAIMLYAEEISKIVKIPNKTEIEVFVMEKGSVKKEDLKTKDGIHIILGITMPKAAQVLLRQKVLDISNNKSGLPVLWEDLPIKNSWEDVLDEGIVRGHVNWQVYGSRKPNNQAYMIKYHYLLEYNKDTKWSIEIQDLSRFDTHKNIMKLSARYTKYPKFEYCDGIEDIVDKLKATLGKKENRKSKIHLVKKNTRFPLGYDKISSQEELDTLIANVFEDISAIDYRLKETHEYTMSLPKSYWGPGSYNKWIRVGWALASTSYRLFPTWLKFSSQDNCRDTLKGSNGKFDWSNVSELYDMWKEFDFDNPDGLSYRSIMYWSKNDARDKFQKIHDETIDHFVEESIKTSTEFDLATVLYHIFKDRFVCASIKNNIWYEYRNLRWHEIDSGSTLRLLISKDMHQIYVDKTVIATSQLQQCDCTDANYEQVRKRSAKLADVAFTLKKTQWKNNIMKEAKELFFDKDFISKLDQNQYLLCFSNYIIDFKARTHRKGQPDDYISKCTNIEYHPLNRKKNQKYIDEIYQFIDELFPNEELRKYMWEHLASILIGTNENQTFNIYTGSGRNGKSVLVELMSRALGDYKGTVPITLITQKRNNIGSTSSEIVQLMGTRYAVMQEPSKGDRINEGIMKEITGGDPIQGRALFKDTVTFIPQFKLVVCTNTLFDVKSNDDGTWRRIRVCDFMSKFLENPYEDEQKFPKSEYPYQYKIDKNINQKFNTWAPVLMSLLVEMAYKNQGNVKDCKVVMASSDQYREGQDYLAEFAKDKIQKKSGEKIKKTEILETFKQWYQGNYGRGVPKGRELYEFMDRRYGKYRQGWHNVCIIYDEDEDDDVMDDM